MTEDDAEEEQVEELLEEEEAEIERRVGFTWVSLERLTEKQEQYVRNLSEEMGFETMAGFAGYMSSHQYDYYDVIRATCRE